MSAQNVYEVGEIRTVDDELMSALIRRQAAERIARVFRASVINVILNH